MKNKVGIILDLTSKNVMPEELFDDLPGTPSVLEGSESVSEDAKTPPAETSAPQPKSEEKTVPYSRFKQVNDELASLKQNKGSSEANLTLEAIKVGKKLEKYSEDEIDSVAKIIKSSNPNDILAALDNDYIKQGIETARAKVAEQNKVPAPGSAASLGFGGKTSADIANMSKEEFQAYEQQVVKERGRSQGI